MANQELSTFFVIKSMVCQSTVHLSTTKLDYRKVYIGQQISLPVTITNTSMLPQKVAFVKLRKEVKIYPNDGFATLLANESITFHIQFSPMSIINYNFDITLLSSVNDTYLIHISGKGIESPITMDHNILHLRTTAPGEKVIESILLTNITTHKQSFEIILPSSLYTWIKISPTVFEMEPKAIKRMEIEYHPPTDLMDINPIEWLTSVKLQIQQQLNTNNNDNNTTTTTTTNNNYQVIEESSIFSIPNKWESNFGFYHQSNGFGKIEWVKPPSDLSLLNDVGNGNDNNNENEEFNEEEKISMVVEKMKNENQEDDVDRINQNQPESIEIEEINNNKQSPSNNNNNNNNNNNLKLENKLKQIKFEKEREKELIENELKADLPLREWGVSGEWNFPIFFKPHQPIHPITIISNISPNKNDNSSNNQVQNQEGKVDVSSPSSTQLSRPSSPTTNNNNLSPQKLTTFGSLKPPFYLSIHTAVIMPQIECDTNFIDFGHLAIGIRQLRTITVSNLGYNSVDLKCFGLNACGPFSIINPVKVLKSK